MVHKLLAQKKPSDFKEMEKAAKTILEAKGENYYKWLHQLHVQIVHELIANNPDSISLLVKGEKRN